MFVEKFSRTENRILGALARLDDFLMNPLIQGHSEIAPETSRNVFNINHRTNGNESQSDPHPGAGQFNTHTTRNSDPEYCHDKVIGVQKERPYGHDLVTGVHEEFNYCSPSTSSGKQKKIRATSQPQFRSENTPATIEADQTLLAPQQLGNNINSANFHNKINRISKFPKSFTSTMPTLDGKSENFALFEEIFQKSLKIHIQLTEEDRINYFSSLMGGGMHYKHLKTLMAQPERN